MRGVGASHITADVVLAMLSRSCVYLMREIADSHGPTVCAALPALAKMVSVTDYPDHFHLLENTWKQVGAVLLSMPYEMLRPG